jgi:hypothetical protein
MWSSASQLGFLSMVMFMGLVETKGWVEKMVARSLPGHGGRYPRHGWRISQILP